MLHCFQKNAQKTARYDLELAITRLNQFEIIKMTKHDFANVWDALADTPQEAANLTMRAELLIAIGQKVANWKGTQVAAAKRLGITQPRLNDLLRGKIDSFSLDALVNIAHRAGLVLRVEIANEA